MNLIKLLKKSLAAFVLPLLLLLGGSPGNSATQARNTNPQGLTGTLKKLIVESGSVTMQVDLGELSVHAQSSSRTLSELRFVVAANSFFTFLVFNDLWRGPEQGSMALVPLAPTLPEGIPAALRASLNQLAVEKLAPGGRFVLAVRDARTGFTFFNVEGHQYNYDAKAQSLSVTGGRLLISKELAKSLGHMSDAGAVVGTISIGAVMQPIEVTHVVNGKPMSVSMPPLNQAAGPQAQALVSGPDIIVGDLPDVEQFGSAGTQVGLAVATTSCNNGDQPVDWFSLPNTDHPFIPQNFYRMSGGANNNERFEQIGHSWGKHAFEALEGTLCGTCNTSGCTTGSQLCPGCSDPYDASLNSGQTGIGSRAWVNPFTGSFPGGTNPDGQPTANDHNGHVHDGVSHRVRVEASDLDTTQNPGATYFAEGQYIALSEFTWCQAHPGQCNMFNNASYRQFSVSGTTTFTFAPLGSTARTQPAIMAWASTAGATVNQIQPDPGNDGISFMGFNVTNPSPGVFHYEYALYNENLDRGIQSFSVPVGPGVNISNVGFHAPPQEPGFANDGTLNDQGYSSTPWTVTQTTDSITWNCETFVQNQNANAIRFGTLYNFRFDADQAPNLTDATVGFFKTGSPIAAVIQAPGQVPTPSPTPTSTPTPTPTASPTPTSPPFCSQYVITPGTDPIVSGTQDIGSHCDDCNTTISLPFPFTLYDQTYNSVNLDSNGNAQFVNATSAFESFCIPSEGAFLDFTIFPFWTDQQTGQISAGSGCSAFPTGCGIFTTVEGTAPNRIFHIEFRTTMFNAGNNHYDYELRLFEGSSTFEIIYGAMVAVNNGVQLQVAGVQGNSGAGFFTQDFCLANTDQPPQNVSRTYTLAACGSPSPTPTASPSATATSTPTATPTASPSPTPTVPPCNTYVTSTTTGNTIVPGVTDTGNHCDDCATGITFPFPVTVYGQTFTTANVSSNGSLDLIGSQSPFSQGCITLPTSSFAMAILPYQDDQRTDVGLAGCATWANGCGIFTAVTGTAPNRTFYIDYHTVHFNNTAAGDEYEVAFYENNPGFFDIIYGITSDNGSGETTGVQASPTGPATTFSCGTAVLTNGLGVRYTCTAGATPTPTATATFTPTPSATATATATPTATATATATPTPTPTPQPITLTAQGFKRNGVEMVNLFWRGATSSNIDIYRNGVLIRTVANIGQFTDNTGQRGQTVFTYVVCESGTQHCSNSVTVRFGGT